MIKLNSNSVAVDEIKDVKKAEKVISEKWKKEEYVLVLGSKPECKIQKLILDIYTQQMDLLNEYKIIKIFMIILD